MKDETKQALDDAHDSMDDLLKAMSQDDDVPFGEWLAAQKALFAVRWRKRVARDGLPGEHFKPEEWHVSGQYEYVRFFGGFTVADPVNPFHTHNVSFDTIIDADGNVSVEVNGTELEHVGQKAGSYVR